MIKQVQDIECPECKKRYPGYQRVGDYEKKCGCGKTLIVRAWRMKAAFLNQMFNDVRITDER